MLSIVLACWPVAAVTASQTLAISKFAGTLYVDESCSKLIIRNILVEEYIYVEIAMTGIDGVTDGGIDRLQARSRNPTLIHNFDDGTERTF